MLRLWADRLARISAGVALLLLLVAEGKVCPGLLAPPTDRDAAQGPGGTSESLPLPDERPAQDEQSQELPSLASMLPDAMPARWPGHVNPAAQEEAAGCHEGTVACGPLKVSATAATGQPTAQPAWWQAFLRLRPTNEIATIAPAVEAFQDAALHTTLLRTGPPLI